MIDVLSLGVGVQSSTVLLMSCCGQLPKLSAAVFADPGWESKQTYKYFDWLKVEAESHGIPIYRGQAGNIREDAIHFRRTGGKSSGLHGAKRFASLPFYVKNPDGSCGIINRQCTSEYKIKVVENIIRRIILKLKPRQRAPKNSIRHWIGISYDERQRAGKKSTHWQLFHYPLITELISPYSYAFKGTGYTRQDCLDWLDQHGYPRPPRSACIGCPFHSDAEWLDMKTNRPEEWADAVAFDHEIRAADAAGQLDKWAGRRVGLPYLHHSLVPLDEVILKAIQEKRDWTSLGMVNECQGMCGL